VAKPVQVVVNSNWAAGMGTSIRAGVSALRASGVDAVMIFLCDQPLITSTMLDQMVAAHFSMIKAITAAHYSDTFGTPVIFSASLMHELSALEEGQGGKAILSRHPDQVAAFALPEAAVDVDTAEDFDRLLKSPNRDL
jgi:molybdenum cofactor cytidylyltransferase